MEINYEMKNIDTVAIDHVAVAVKSIESTLQTFIQIGGKAGEREVISDQGVETQAIEFSGNRIELLQPISDTSPVGKFIVQRGEGLHHIAFLVRDIRSALEQARESGIKLIDESPRRGAGGKLIAFLHPKSTGGVLIELTQIEL